MMINLKLDDDLYNTYLQRHGAPGHYKAMGEALKAFKDVKKGDRVLMLHGEGRQRVEAIFETTLDDAAKLERLARNLCSVKIGPVEVTFTSDQLARMKMQAEFHGRTLERYVQETVTELVQKMMEEV